MADYFQNVPLISITTPCENIFSHFLPPPEFPLNKTLDESFAKEDRHQRGKNKPERNKDDKEWLRFK